MSELTQAELKRVLHYNPETGYFTWLQVHPSKVTVGDRAGTIDRNGYVYIGVGGKRRLSHRLAYFYVTGGYPPEMLDHINCVKTDNRWANLRLADSSKNMQNTKCVRPNATGFKGVRPHPDGKHFTARIYHEGKRRYLGKFTAAEEAHQAYCRAADAFFGEFANYGH